MKRTLSWVIPTAILVFLVAWRFVAMQSDKAKVLNQATKGKGAASVLVAPTESRTITEVIQSVGNVESPFKVQISPKTSGRIDYLEAREGDLVTPGQVLLRIDPSDLQGAVLQQQASVAEARARYAQAKINQNSTNVGVTSQIQQQQAGLGSVEANLNQVQQNYAAQVATASAQVSAAESAVANSQATLDKENATLHNLEIKYDRTVYLYKQNFIAAQDVDDARTAIEVQKGAVLVAQGQLAANKSQLKVQQQNKLIVQRKGLADIAASKANVTQGKATLQFAQANRSQSPAYQQNLDALQSQIVAAEAQLKQAQAKLADTVIASTITGTVTARKADPGALATPGTPVLEVQFLDWVYVTATLPIDQGALIHPGQIAEITIDGLPGKTFSGPVANINPAADPQNRQFGIKVRLENKDHSIRPGMYGRVKIVTGQVKAQVVVPREALITDSSGATTVVVVDPDKVAHVKAVKLGVSDDRGAQILDGVDADDKVVVLTFNPIKEGQKVSISTPGDSSKKGGKGKKTGGAKQTKP